jgi:ribosomal protein S4
MNYYRPYYKKIIHLNEILVTNYKIFKFKHKKWLQFILYVRKQVIKNKLNKFKFIDQEKLILDDYSNNNSNYKRSYKLYFTCIKRLKCLYLNILKKTINHNLILFNIIKLINRRIDVNLIKCKFCLTLRQAKKLIINGYIFINKHKFNIKSYVLNCGDLINIKISVKNYKQLLINSFKWNLPNNNLIINYSNKEILFFNLPKIINLLFNLPYYLYLNIIFIT